MGYFLNSSYIVYCSFNTVNGKYCCNYKNIWVVGNVNGGFNTVNGKYCCNGEQVIWKVADDWMGFNTVNGKYCCNLQVLESYKKGSFGVSIP